jgi:hypothetical protein
MPFPEFVLFDPRAARGKYIHVDGVADGFYGKLPPTLADSENGFAYGAFILENYTKWEPEPRILKLHYLLSTFSPYQVHVMYSEVYIPPVLPPASLSAQQALA